MLLGSFKGTDNTEAKINALIKIHLQLFFFAIVNNKPKLKTT